MAIVLIYRHKVKQRKWRFFSAFCALWLPFTLVNLAVALSVIIHDWSWQSTYYVAISNVPFFIRTQEKIIEAQSFSHATLNKRRQWPFVSFIRQWDVVIKIGPNSRRNNKSQSEYELRIKTDSTRRKSSWNQPDWGRWKSIFHQPRVHVFAYMGAVRCIGYLSDPNGGEWKGIELDHPHPQGNDGFFDGVRYFTREQRHDIFPRPSVVFHHKNAENVTAATNISLETIAFIQTNIQRCCPSNVNYFVTMLTRYWSLSQRSYFEPHSESEAWQLSTQL